MCSYAVRAAPGSLGGLLHVGVQADHVVRPGTRVTQDDLAALLAHLAVVLVVRLVAVALLRFWRERDGVRGGSQRYTWTLHPLALAC